MVRKWVVSTDSIEWMVTMLGWLIAATALASRRKVDHAHAPLAEHAGDLVPG